MDEIIKMITDQAVADPPILLTPVELAEAMIDYSKLSRELEALEAMISRTVLSLGKTQTVGDVRATYSNGRGSYDYESAAREMLSEDRICQLTPDHTKSSVDWRSLCKSAGIDNLSEFYTQTSGPSVSIKRIK